ncbi:MAG: D-2-hydroxyacid dehydrogenase [Eubacteriales bacterium]
MKIVVLDGFTLNPGDLSWEGFEGLGEFVCYDRTAAIETISRIGDAEIVITNKTAITKEVMDSCKNIKYIGVLATGYNVVDFAYAKELGIPVCNVPTYGTTAVAQFVFAMLLDICHSVKSHSDEVKKGRWTECEDFCFWDSPLIELAGKTMGIIGFGKIGQNTGKIANAFGMKVLAYDEYPNKAAENENTKYVELDELLASSDVISLHCPLFENTKGVINKETIERMKDGVIIINTSRGPLIVEDDLAVALDSGKVYYSAHDVTEVEPIPADNVFLSRKNTIVTPHIAWAPRESRSRLMDVAVENLAAFIQGNPQNNVNK